ncbi:hypothetical protein FXO37_27625 [Capsicum annuum]|nr:hypothetical protein FXO37_27625 [Capsicum annuum]
MGSTNQDEDDAIIGAAATSVLAFGVAIIVAYEHKSSIPREPYVNKDQEREFYMNSILNGSHIHCVNRVYSSMLSHYASSSFEALSNPYKITGWNHPTGDNEQPLVLSLITENMITWSLIALMLCKDKKFEQIVRILDKRAHPNHDKFINKKIKIFDKISLVCENDRARGDCAKSFEDIDFDNFSEKDNDNELEGPSIEKDVQVTEVSQIKASRKRKHSFEAHDVPGDISIKFGEVTTAIGRMVDSRLDVTKLYEEVMAIEGYNEEFLGDAFDYCAKRHFS